MNLNKLIIQCWRLTEILNTHNQDKMMVRKHCRCKCKITDFYKRPPLHFCNQSDIKYQRLMLLGHSGQGQKILHKRSKNLAQHFFTESIFTLKTYIEFPKFVCELCSSYEFVYISIFTKSAFWAFLIHFQHVFEHKKNTIKCLTHNFYRKEDTKNWHFLMTFLFFLHRDQ